MMLYAKVVEAKEDIRERLRDEGWPIRYTVDVHHSATGTYVIVRGSTGNRERVIPIRVR